MRNRFFAPALLILIFTIFATSNTYAESDKIRLSTNVGDIVVELFSDRAPESAKNFRQYVADGFYDGTIFHRVIDGFMIQGGGYTAEFNKKETRDPIPNEANNGVKNDKYTLAMARTSAPHSATAQFFINTVNNDFLNHSGMTMRGWGYTVFGRVLEGHDVVDRIGQSKTGSGGPFARDVPVDTITIEQAAFIGEEDGNSEKSASADSQ